MSDLLFWLVVGGGALIALIAIGWFLLGSSADEVMSGSDVGMDQIEWDEPSPSGTIIASRPPDYGEKLPPPGDNVTLSAGEEGSPESAGPAEVAASAPEPASPVAIEPPSLEPAPGWTRPPSLGPASRLPAANDGPRIPDFGSGAGGAGAAPGAAVLPALDPREYRVWFGTNRAPKDPDDLSKGFSGERGDTVQHGHCDVYVPRSHKRGSTGSSLWVRIVTWTDDRLKINRIAALAEADYWSAVAAQIAAAPKEERHALIYIHGYKNSFDDAAIRAAQIGFDLGVRGAMAFFSWPSRGALDDYSTDEDSIQASEKEIATFIASFKKKTRATKVHIIAHSMGNRGLLRAVNEIVHMAAAEPGEDQLFGEIILAAADIDAKNFRDYSPAYGKVAAGTTLYVSERDKAVGFSSWKHGGYPRIGYAPPIQIFPEIETVTVSELDLDFLGHGYVAEALPVIEDMRELFYYGRRAAGRTGRLDQRQDEQGRTYWAVRA